MIKIKVIDLLNMISKGEELPKKIQFDNIIFIFQDGEYISNNGDGSCLDQFMCFYYKDLNKEIEIIEEDKKIEKIWFSLYEMERVNKEVLEKIEKKINEIIDKLNSMEE